MPDCKIVARCLFDYEARTDEELTIREGDLLFITDDTDQEWWMATEKPVDAFQEAHSGLVPMSYVEEAQPISLATALYDYNPATNEEIALREGQHLRVYEKVDADWWFVKQDNHVGLAPATYIEEQVPTVQSSASATIISPPSQDAASSLLAPEKQKHLLLNALGGLGFSKPKSDPKSVGQIYGPDELVYFPVTELDKKKKKNSKKGFIAFSEKELLIYFVDNPTREIVSKTPVSELTRYKDKKTKLVFEFEDKEAREYEGEKSEISKAVASLEHVLQISKSGAQNSSPPATHVAFAAIQPVPIQIESVMAPPPLAAPSSASRNVMPTMLSKRVVAIYDYDPVEEGELAIRENDILVVVDDSDPDWWLVKHTTHNKEGLVPKTYVEEETDIDNSRAASNESVALYQAREHERQQIQEHEAREMEIRHRAHELEEQRRMQQVAEEQRRHEQEQLEHQRQMEQLEHQRQMEQQQQQAMAISSRSKIDTPVAPIIPTRPTVQKQPEVPKLPTRPLQANTLAQIPQIPARPTVPTGAVVKSVQVSVAAPTIPDRPKAPASRPVAAGTTSTSTTTAPPKEKPAPNLLRKWTDRTGSFEMDAQYLGIKDGRVQLHKSNGVKIAVPIEKLCQSDLNYLKSLPGNEKLITVNTPAPALAPPKAKTGTSSNNTLSKKETSKEYMHGDFNWLEWLIHAGLASNDAAAIARQFAEQRLDVSMINDISREALRQMLITEGDIIRIRKAANLQGVSSVAQQTITAREKEAQSRNLQMLDSRLAMKMQNTSTPSNALSDQLKSDEVLARELQNMEVRNARGGTVRKSSVGANAGSVNAATIYQAGNLLKAATIVHRQTDNAALSAPTTNFSVPPATQSVSSNASLGLKASGNLLSNNASSNDPWNGATNSIVNSAAQNTLLKVQQQQEEAKQKLANAELAIRKAQESNRQATLLEQQNKAAQMQTAQAEASLLKAQETERQAMILQQQAHMNLLNAQRSAFQNPMTNITMTPRTLAAPLIPTNTQSVGRFIPTGPTTGNAFGNQTNPLQTQFSGAQGTMNPLQPQHSGNFGMANSIQMQHSGSSSLMNPLQTQYSGSSGITNPLQMQHSGGLQTMVTSDGVVKPNWMNTTPQMPFGPPPSGPALASGTDKYSAFKDANATTQSVFGQTNQQNMMSLNSGTGSGVFGAASAYQTHAGSTPNFNMQQANPVFFPGFQSAQSSSVGTNGMQQGFGVTNSEMGTGLGMNPNLPMGMRSMPTQNRAFGQQDGSLNGMNPGFRSGVGGAMTLNMGVPFGNAGMTNSQMGMPGSLGGMNLTPQQQQLFLQQQQQFAMGNPRLG
ncbi:hypothetical protein QVD99_002863 [Batrachochytrium dendrobatidis]|nr:hypothetical protein QVD99_002863 [Batrachochytrium dendrobatidis]